MGNKLSILFILFALLANTSILAQSIEEQLREAQQLERSFNDKEALARYLEIIREDPNHHLALCKASQLYNLLGKRQATKEKQKEYYRKAWGLAQRALNLNPNSSEANFSMSLAMGRMALISSGEEKIKAVKEIKAYAEKAIELDPKNFRSYHVLGKWYYEVSELSAIERWLVKVTFGALPKATLEDAIRNYEKSHQLNPGFILNYLELARAYSKKDNVTKAVALLNTMMKLPPSSSDDSKIKVEGKKLLESLR